MAPNFPALSKVGRYAVLVKGDGNCLFRALADQYFGDQERFAEIRRRVVQHFRQNRHLYEPYIYGSFDTYVEYMAQNASWGGEIEMRAFAREFGTDVYLYEEGVEDQRRGISSNLETEARASEGEVHIAYTRHGRHYWSGRVIEGNTSTSSAASAPDLKTVYVDMDDVKKLRDAMGSKHSVELIVNALEAAGGDVEKAIDYLLPED